MQCSTCGMDNQSATRFCIHCGAAQTPPAEGAGASTVIVAMAQAGTTAKTAPATPPWATPSGAANPRQDAAGTGMHAQPGRGGPVEPASAPFAYDAGGTGAVRQATLAQPPAPPEAVAFEQGDEPSAFTPPPAAGVGAGSEPLPSFSDATAFTMPASATSASGAGARAGESAAASTSRTTSWVAQPDDVAEAPAVRAAVASSAQAPLAEVSPSRTDATGVLPRSSMPPPVAAPQAGVDPAAASPSLPAYDAAPRHRSGMLIVVGLAVLALLGIGGFFFYQMSKDHAGDGAPGTATADATSRSGSAPAAGDTASTAASSAAPSSQAADTTLPPAPVPTPVPTSPTASDVDSAKATPAPSSPATTPAVEPPEKRPVPRAPAPKSTRPAGPVTPPPAPAVEEPVITPAAPPARPAPAPAAPRAADRWAQMSDELTRCRREDFINRVVCDQRVRLRYCDGYWGKVAQCPAAPQADHGQ